MNDDIAMMQNPVRWPLYPFLCVKHRTQQKAVGTIIKFYPLRVYKINFYSINKTTKLDRLPRVEYPTIEALAEDWKVD